MIRISENCPIRIMVRDNPERYKEGWQNGLISQAIMGLSHPMCIAVRGTKDGLIEDRIDEIRVKSATEWGRGAEEYDYLDQHPEIANAVHDCEMAIQLGNCAVFSKPIGNDNR